MLTASPTHILQTESTDTISHIVLKAPRAHVIESNGDGFGSYIERLINVAHTTHQSFPNLMHTLNDLINFIHKELERTYDKYQFSIIAGNHFDHEQILSSHFALIEHTGIKILIFSSIGCSYKIISTTTTDNINDNLRSLPW
ncbi:unnamed protein product [Adineta steineri]|uniref:Uncharacterized protein n=1 Tax=Adineta steineri TaxID=433720 RepID=A0A815QIS0_9BILA|nr:unnamed protein product [Adineta steineri]CAF3579755.1 unnamed protein product [Adineta steineri]